MKKFILYLLLTGKVLVGFYLLTIDSDFERMRLSIEHIFLAWLCHSKQNINESAF